MSASRQTHRSLAAPRASHPHHLPQEKYRPAAEEIYGPLRAPKATSRSSFLPSNIHQFSGRPTQISPSSNPVQTAHMSDDRTPSSPDRAPPAASTPRLPHFPRG